MFRSKELFRQAFGRQNISNGNHPPSFYLAAFGSILFYQICDNQSAIGSPSRTTFAEASSGDGDGDDRLPWYRRVTYQRRAGGETGDENATTKATANKIGGKKGKNKTGSDEQDMDALFEGQCLKRQLWTPRIPYPAWDYNWDGKVTPQSTQEACSTARGLQASCETGTTRHLILIRHGQYEEDSSDDQYRTLTPLGQKQATLTGLRLAKLARVLERNDVPLKAIHMSDMMRAKQTAAIIAQYLPKDIVRTAPDPNLNEALPAPMIPMRPDIQGATEEIDANQDRMNQVFHKYCYRADSPMALLPPPPNRRGTSGGGGSSDIYPATSISVSGSVLASPTPPPSRPPPPNHEFEIIVGHGNVIRYFVCRALQLPPEAWLRFSVFNCSMTYMIVKPNGYVSVRMIGDIGHLGNNETTFSGLHGFLWS